MELTQVDASLYNADLAPIPPEKRSWGVYNYASLWVAMSVCIPTYMLASGLIAGGMNWIQAVLTILLGNLIVLVPMLLNAHAGTRYGIPFPVFVRASFGVRGANVPAVLRALVACGWFGIQAWIGGQAIYSMLRIVWPGAATIPGSSWICFFAFWAINMMVIWRGIETIKILQGIGAPFFLAVGLLLLFWITGKAGGFGPVLHTPSKFHSTSDFMHFFYSGANRDGRFLGDRGAEYSRLHAICQIATRTNGWAGAGFAHRHDFVRVYRRGGDFRIGGNFWRADLGSGRAARTIQSADGRPDRAGGTAAGHVEHQCGGKCGFPLE